MKIKIRKFRNEDAQQVSRFIIDCFIKLDIGKHTKKGLEIQINRNSPDEITERSKSVEFFVAVDGGKVVGICGYDSEKVHGFFVDREYHKKGIGRLLLNKILNEAKIHGLKKIKTWSTIYANKFYEKNGFIKLKEIYVPEGTKDIGLIEMEKILQKDF